MGAKEQKEKKEQYRHFIFVEAPLKKVARLACLWERAPWWPQKAPLIINDMSGKEPGALVMKAEFPFFSALDGKIVESHPEKGWARIYDQKNFLMKETLNIEGRLNGSRVDYLLEVEIKGFRNKFLWSIFFKDSYNEAIRSLLQSLKEYLLNQGSRAGDT